MTPESARAGESGSPLTPERWRVVAAVLGAALERPPAERSAFVTAECGADAELRGEVESLLAAAERAESSLGVPTAWRAEAVGEHGSPAASTEAAAGNGPDAARLAAALEGRYRLERELGRGGMATVYLARDLRHRRPVALKVLHPGVGALLGPSRFRREIETAANLRHPHILPLFDSGEADGLLYYTMPYVTGESLRERLNRLDGPLPLPEALSVLREVADALAHAHRRGVVHRDIKPGNILLEDGHVVVADFGIARALRRARETEVPENPGPVADGPIGQLTDAGVTPGTPAYMAPEQAVGDPHTDHRADLYALGVVAYEMLAGAHPFGNRSPVAFIAAHLSESPEPLAARRPDLPAAVASLVMRLLAKDPADRPSSAEAVLHMLAGVPAKAPRSPLVRRRAVLAFVAVLLTLGSAAYLVGRRARVSANERVSEMRPSSTPSPVGAPQALAVLPFVNTGGDAQDEYFSDGLTDELAHALGRLPGLRLAGRTSSYAFKGKEIPAPQIGRTLGVAALVNGTVRRSGDRMRVTAQLVNTADGTVRWDSVFESRAGEVFAVQDKLARSIVAALAPALGGRTDAAVRAERGTADPEAYELYLKGHYYFLMRGTDNAHRAIAYFQQAIERDPGFARAYAGLVRAYRILPIYLPVAMDSIVPLMDASARRAVALDSTLADAQQMMANTLWLQLRFRDADRHYRTAVALDPSSATIRLDYGFHLMSLGHTDEGLVELKRALQLDPLVKSAASAVTLGYMVAHRYPEALAAAHYAFALDSTFPLAIEVLGLAQAFGGQPDRAVTTLERGVRLHPRDSRLVAYLVFAYAAAGRWDDGQRIREQLHRPGTELMDGTEAAFADLVFGDREPLVRLLTSPEGQRRYEFAGGVFGCNPLRDPLWADARYRAAMTRLGVAPCPLARPWPLPPRPSQAVGRRS